MQDQFKILLVEDDEELAKLLSNLLLRDGYLVELCKTIDEALGKLLSDDFDLLVSDIALDDGTGFDLIRKIRERSQIPAIAIGGFGKQAINVALASGFDAHLTKRELLSQLEGAIQKLLSAKGRRRAS